jgi:methionyl-tRNA formyltransferase
VKQAAIELHLPVVQPERIRRPEHVSAISTIHPDLMVVVGYGQIIPQNIIDIPAHGILNVHASLLPKYRGAAPIQWAIANGDIETGVTIMRINAGLDTGDMLLKRGVGIQPDETAPELSARLAAVGATLLIDAIKQIELGTATYQAQDDGKATYAPILTKEDGRVDWPSAAATIYNRLRGFTPWPGAHTVFRGQTLQIHSARPVAEPNSAAAGTLSAGKRTLMVMCGSGALGLLEVQPEGKKRMRADAFLNGYSPRPGERFGE